MPMHAETLLDAVLGGLVYGIAAAFPRADNDARGRAEQVQWPDIVDRHLTRSVELVAEHVRSCIEQGADFVQRLVH
jgi:hypothetical protein